MTIAQTINSATRRIPAWPLYIVGMLPAVWFFYLGATNQLGPEPIKEFEHRLGEFGLQVFIVVLAITPLRNWTKISLIKYRRALGLLVFYYILLHLCVWLFLDVQIWSQIWADIVKRPYITIGMLAFTLLIPVAVTSNNWSIRKMGPQMWKRWHWLSYPAAVLGATHFVMLVKTWQPEPLIYLGIVCALLATRIKWNRRAATA